MFLNKIFLAVSNKHAENHKNTPQIKLKLNSHYMRLSHYFLPQYGPEHLSDLGNTCESPQHLSAAHLVIW